MPHIFLEALCVPFALKLVEPSRNAQKPTAYLHLNPNGLVPVLVPALGAAERTHCAEQLVNTFLIRAAA